MSSQRISVRLFENDFLERLSFASPALVIAVWLPLIAATGTYGALHAAKPTAILTAIIALLGWTLFEYVVHRFVFHLVATSRRGKWLLFVLHGCHHADPQDRLRNMMTPAVTITIGGLFLALFVAVAGTGLGMVAFAGFMTGYVAYDLTHYACHQMKLPWMKGLKQRHLAHHFAGQEANFAVTLPIWDRLFGTRLTKLQAGRHDRAR